MSKIRQSAKQLLEILYEQYVGENPIDPISLDDITAKLGKERPSKEIMASLNYLTDKEYITPLSHNQQKGLSYRLTPKGIEHHEREMETSQGSQNGPLITFGGDMKGQLHLNSYGTYGEDHSQSHQNIQSDRENETNDDTIFEFIDWVRSLADEDIPTDLKDEIEMRCDVMESFIRSSNLPL